MLRFLSFASAVGFELVDVDAGLQQQVELVQKRLLNPPPFKLVDLLAGKREGMVEDQGKLPVVFMHGMGDAGDNSGMQEICKHMADTYNVYTVCLDVDDGFSSITTVMDDQLAALTKIVQSDPKLAGGFNAMGMSQGGLLMRSYINRVNNPPVSRYVSLCGTQNGVDECPSISYVICPIWRYVMNPYKTEIVFSDYWKDSTDEATYLKESRFLADVNNEKETKNATYRNNMLGLNMYMLIEANPDGMVYPHASESHGYYKWGTDKSSDVQLMRDTEAYKGDWLGLKTLDQQGRIVELKYQGQHMQIPSDMLFNQVLPTLAESGPYKPGKDGVVAV